MLNRFIVLLRSAFEGMWRAPFVHAVAVLTIAIALFASGLAREVERGMGRLLDAWGSEVEMTLYLSDALSPDEAQKLRARVEADARGEVAFVSAGEALSRLKRELGEMGAVVDKMGRNPLPATFELRPGPSLRSAQAMASLAAHFSQLPGVTSVDYGREWVERVEALSRSLRAAALVGLSLILIAAMVVVAATLQLAVYTRREEIEIQRLVGATDTFVKAPFVIEGLLQGLIGALAAAGALAGCYSALAPKLKGVLGFVRLALPEGHFPTPQGTLELLLAGLALGTLGSLLAVGRFLRS